MKAAAVPGDATWRAIAWSRVHVVILCACLAAAWLISAGHLAMWARAHPDIELIHGHDDRRYFATAHSLWIDGDLDFANEYARFAPESLAEFTPSGRLANKYGVGMPVLAGPPMLAARVLGIGGDDVMGRGAQATFALWNAALGLAGIGLMIVVAGRVAGAGVAIWAGAAMLAGTSAAWYVLVQPTMSHAAGLLCYAGVLWAWERRYVAHDARNRWLLLGGLGIGVAASVRMQDAALGVLFVVAELLRHLTPVESPSAQPDGSPDPPVAQPPATIVAIATAAAVFGLAAVVGILPQLVYQKFVWGGWLIDAYAEGGEYFNWGRPALIGLLLSTRNSLLFYAPISLAGIAGLCLAGRWGFLPRRSHLAPLLAVAVAFYINAAWHLWTMGDSFGARGLLNCWGFLLVGVAVVLARAWGGDAGGRPAGAAPAPFRPLAKWLLAAALLGLLLWGILMLLLYYTEAIPHNGRDFDLSTLLRRVGTMLARLNRHLGSGP